jgi:hypothetical protein
MRRVIATVVLCLLAVSCKKESGVKGLPPASSVSELINKPLDLNRAVVGKPASLISVLAPIDIIFNEPVVPPHLASTTLDKSPFTFKPEIKGVARWVSQNLLRFTPDNPLAAGVTYEAALNGKQAFGSQRNVNDFTFSFKTAEQEVVEFSGDFEPDTGGVNVVRYKGALTFAQAVDLGKVTKDLSCSVAGRSCKITLESDAQNPARIGIVSEPLQRRATGQMLTLSLPAAYTAEKDKWTSDLLLPEINAFKVLAHMDMTEPQSQQSTYGFRFSDPVRTGADLSGYITIDPNIKFTVSIDKKFLKLQGPFLIGQEYKVTIAKGFQSAFGTKLSDNFVAVVSLSNLKPEIRWLSRGIYLPSDNSFKLQFKSVNVRKVRCRITEIFENNLGFFIQTNVLHEPKQSARAGDDDESEYEGGYYGGNYDYNDVNRVGKEVFDSTLALTTDKNKWIRSELDLSHIQIGRAHV